jgi:hypothetical protein
MKGAADCSRTSPLHQRATVVLVVLGFWKLDGKLDTEILTFRSAELDRGKGWMTWESTYSYVCWQGTTRLFSFQWYFLVIVPGTECRPDVSVPTSATPQNLKETDRGWTTYTRTEHPECKNTAVYLSFAARRSDMLTPMFMSLNSNRDALPLLVFATLATITRLSNRNRWRVKT